MLNILRTDIYKAIRTASFWVILGITALVSVLLSFAEVKLALKVYNDLSNAGQLSSDLMPKFFQLVPLSLGVCVFLVGIFAIMFSISDFSNTTIKNVASKGYRREYIYLSKFISVLLFAVLSLVLAFVTSFLTAQIVVNNAIPQFFTYDNEFAKTLGFLSLQIVTYVAIAVFLSTTFRSLGPALTSFLVFVFLEDKIVEWINNFINNILHSDFSITPYTISGAFSNPDQITQGVIVLCTYILVFTAVGLYTFRKRDIN